LARYVFRGTPLSPNSQLLSVATIFNSVSAEDYARRILMALKRFHMLREECHILIIMQRKILKYVL
jgi:hypothetical protein